MSEQTTERHILIIDDNNGRRSIALEAATYSLGRDQTNAIVLESKGVSRQHALLLRLPVPETSGYRYRLVDGNSAGKPSANGVIVNSKRCSSADLINGDALIFGGEVKASYLVVSMEQAEFVKYLDAINFQSIKSEPMNAKATLVGEEFTSMDFDPEVEVGEMTQFSSRPPADLKKQPALAGGAMKFWMVGIGGMLLGLMFGTGVIMATGQLNNVAPKQAKTNVVPKQAKTNMTPKQAKTNVAPKQAKTAESK
jgi:pSer/pThr/pTyr-binding forkhead associated (FHA) protein